MRSTGFRKSKRGRSRMPARRMAGHSTMVIAAMPAVVPTPSSASIAGSSFTCSIVGSPPATRRSSSSTHTSTMLLSTGAKAGAAKRLRLFNSAVPTAVRP